MGVRPNFIIIVGVMLSLVACAVRAPVESGAKDLAKTSCSGSGDITTTEQVGGKSKTDSAELLHVEQISNDNEPPDFTFSYVEGDDPCALKSNRELVQCSPEFADQRGNLATMRNRRRSNALSDLQAITPDIVDPLEFDPDRTIDELGRTDRRLKPQAGLAIGAEFLAPPQEPQPQPEPEELDADRGLKIQVPEPLSPRGRNQ